jgi:hypothetical protein
MAKLFGREACRLRPSHDSSSQVETKATFVLYGYGCGSEEGRWRIVEEDQLLRVRRSWGRSRKPRELASTLRRMTYYLEAARGSPLLPCCGPSLHQSVVVIIYGGVSKSLRYGIKSTPQNLGSGWSDPDNDACRWPRPGINNTIYNWK